VRDLHVVVIDVLILEGAVDEQVTAGSGEGRTGRGATATPESGTSTAISTTRATGSLGASTSARSFSGYTRRPWENSATRRRSPSESAPVARWVRYSSMTKGTAWAPSTSSPAMSTCNLHQQAEHGLQPLLVEGEVAQRVREQLSLVAPESLGNVRMVGDDQCRPGVHRALHAAKGVVAG